MGKIKASIATKNGEQLSAEKSQLIFRAMKTAEDYTFPRLKINWDIHAVVMTDFNEVLIPEDGVGGRTFLSSFIALGIDLKKINENKLSEMLCHELCHAARWGKNDEWASCLFDNIINEGIATYFEAELAKTRTEKQFFIQTITNRSEAENLKIVEKLKNQFGAQNYDYNTIFYNGDAELPRWAGYSAGYSLVEKYLEKTGKKIENAFADNYADFRSIL